MKTTVDMNGENARCYGHTTPSRVTVWLRRNRGLMLIYGVGTLVMLLQLRSIL